MFSELKLSKEHESQSIKSGVFKKTSNQLREKHIFPDTSCSMDVGYIQIKQRTAECDILLLLSSQEHRIPKLKTEVSLAPSKKLHDVHQTPRCRLIWSHFAVLCRKLWIHHYSNCSLNSEEVKPEEKTAEAVWVHHQAIRPRWRKKMYDSQLHLPTRTSSEL